MLCKLVLLALFSFYLAQMFMFVLLVTVDGSAGHCDRFQVQLERQPPRSVLFGDLPTGEWTDKECFAIKGLQFFTSREARNALCVAPEFRSFLSDQQRRHCTKGDTVWHSVSSYVKMALFWPSSACSYMLCYETVADYAASQMRHLSMIWSTTRLAVH